MALRLVTNQYQAGIVAFSSMITTQIIAYDAQKSANDVTGLQLTAAVGLIKALGGSWVMEPRPCPIISSK